MKPEEIQLTDWMRIILGNVPWSFLIESVIRITFLYLLVVIAMRALGKRMAAQLSRHEMAALVSLAAGIGVPMLAPDRGLLPALIIAAVIIGIERVVARWSFNSKRFERMVNDDISILVHDGQLVWPSLNETVMTRDRLFAQLRSEGIDHLGMVERVYLEANGAFTIRKFEKPQPGLSIVPDWDTDLKDEQPKAPNTFACHHCGNVNQSRMRPTSACTECGSIHWTEAVVSNESENEARPHAAHAPETRQAERQVKE